MTGIGVRAVFMNVANLLLLRGGPQHMPASWPFTALLLAVYVLQNLLTGQQLEDEAAGAKSLAAIALQILLVAGLLRWRRYQARFAQTLGSLVAVGIVFNAITWVLLNQADPAQPQPALALAWFGTFLWSLFVDAHIYRHALAVSLSQGMLVTVMMLAASYIFIDLFFLGG